MDPRTRTRLASTGVLLLVLVTGFLLGIVWDRTAASGPAADLEGERNEETATRSDEDDRRDRRRDGHRGRRLIVHGVAGLSLEQESRVDSIVDRHIRTIEAIQEELKAEYDPRSREVLMNTRHAIRAVLSEAQALTYDSLLAAHDRRQDEVRARGH